MTELSAPRIKALAKIRDALSEALPTPEERAAWLLSEATSVIREAHRALRPLERFDVAADDPQGAF
jgi:hypothetical protein